MNKFEEFLDRLDAELERHTSAWSKMEPDELITRSKEITAVRDAYGYLTEPQGFSLDEINDLLSLPDILQTAADKWKDRMEDMSDFGFAMAEVYREVESLRHNASVREMDAIESPHRDSFPPVYERSFQEAVTRGELEQFVTSRNLNVECAQAIDTALAKNFDTATYDLDTEAASREVVGKFGFDRTMAVLANTVRHYSFDGRFSDASREWAQGQLRLDSQEMGEGCLVSANAGLTDQFVGQVSYDYLMTQPLKMSDIRAEAKQLMEQFQAASEPNSSDGAHFAARMSPDFIGRAAQKDRDMLMEMLPFSSLTFISPAKDGDFAYAAITSTENRNQRLRKPSVKAQLGDTAPQSQRDKGREPPKRGSVLSKLQEREPPGPHSAKKGRDAR